MGQSVYRTTINNKILKKKKLDNIYALHDTIFT